MKASLGVIIALCLSGTAFADDTEDRIAQLDQDNDGQLSRMEVTGNDQLSASFEEVDANGDGLLSEDEIDEGPFDDFDEIGEDNLSEDPVSEEDDWETEAVDAGEDDSATPLDAGVDDDEGDLDNTGYGDEEEIEVDESRAAETAEEDEDWNS